MYRQHHFVRTVRILAFCALQLVASFLLKSCFYHCHFTMLYNFAVAMVTDSQQGSTIRTCAPWTWPPVVRSAAVPGYLARNWNSVDETAVCSAQLWFSWVYISSVGIRQLARPYNYHRKGTNLANNLRKDHIGIYGNRTRHLVACLSQLSYMRSSCRRCHLRLAH